jgi:3-oxoacyl-[acyl-carrier protein] reductase
MTMCAAQTLAKYGVTANAIMPRARTRMNDSGILAAMFAKPADGFDTFAPENVSPLVAFLASPRAAAVNGYVMIVWGKEIVMVDKPGTDTKFVSEAPWTVDAVERKLVPYASAREPIFGGFTVKPA